MLPVAIQGHIDMVCEKNSDSNHNFDTDPIEPWIDGDWIKAKGTTLGGDNGIGIAMGMAILDSKDIPHPALELLCTLDEETGLTGAMSLSRDLLKAKLLINLDSEEDDAFTIGCAGGMNSSGSFKYEAEAVPAGSVAFNVAIKGLMGGHSGIEIHDGRANAIKFLNRLFFLSGSEIDLRISSMKAGNAHNAIPREAFAVITLPSEQVGKFKEFVSQYDQMIKSEYSSKEPGINATITEVALPERVISKSLQASLIKSFYAMPHGVYRMSPDIKGLVQTSTNFAIVDTRENEIFVLTSQRSSVETEKIDMAIMVRNALELGGAEVKQGDGYPAWPPNVNSPILQTAKDIYTRLFGHAPRIEAIHAGLECGLIGEKYPGMDMLSFGPNLKDVHSPAEKIQISSTNKIWILLLEILKNIPKK
jgi:dipeptidase D